jgi:UDP-2,3-diacylglucosamine pyrophosphatase LpxH
MPPPEPSPAGRRHTLIVSDVHLSQTHPEDPDDPLWMRYRTRAFHPDADYASLVDHLVKAHEGDTIELVFNGDVLDFDAPWVKDGTSSFEEFPLTDAGCAEHVRRLIADHPVWFRAVARALNAGHRLLLLSGNHDVELYWPGVRRAVREEILALCRAEAAPGAHVDTVAIEARIRFRAWFHLTEDRVYIEHGSQYDMFNGVRHAMLPLTKTRDWIHPQVGKLAFKRTGSRMGYFNPYLEETFYLGLTGYLKHFYRFYARSPRHIIRTWFLGALRTAAEIWRHRHREDWTDEARALARAETGASDEAINATQALVARPAEELMIPVVRELWLDRLFLVAFVAVVSLVAFLILGHAAIYVLLTLLALVAVYEAVTPKPDIRTYDSAPPTIKGLFEIHDARAVCLGHTHRPHGAWEPRGGILRFYGNSGSWCPAFHDQECTKPVLAARPVLFLTGEAGEVFGGLHWWNGSELVPEAGAVRERDVKSEEPAASG